MPQNQRRADDPTQVTIIYPLGCKEVTEDLGPDELIRRLKTLAHNFQGLGQEENAYQEFIPLSLHLADDYFLTHPSKDVQLLVACCIADILRVYAPDAPYKDPEQVKTIFMFLIDQLSGLKDPKDPAFKRYFYLLENLSYVKSFHMCFDLEDSQEIFCKLFSLLFRIVNDEHSHKVRSFMLDLMYPLITEADFVSGELLDIVLTNIVDPQKSQRKNAYILAKDLIIKTSDTLEPHLQAFFNHELFLEKEEKKMNISNKVYDLIYELYQICPNVLLSILPQVEFKLKSPDEHERLNAVALMARMFSEPNSKLAVQYKHLWNAFLGRFNDISVNIRSRCVQYAMHFLINHPELRDEIIEALRSRQHDSEESVRYLVVDAIVATAKKDYTIVCNSEELLNFVKERALDKKFKIRKAALCGLAWIYKLYLKEPQVPEATKKAATWIKDKVLHGYYMISLDDRLLVERLLNTCLVPYTLASDERMKKLYFLFATLDENATKAFIELQKHQLNVRKLIVELVDSLQKDPLDETNLNSRVQQISKYLPDPVKVQEYIKKFALHLIKDKELMQRMKVIINPDVTCNESAASTAELLKKLGQPVMINVYYNTIKMLMERVTSVMIDRDALKILTEYVELCLTDPSWPEKIGLNDLSAGEKGLKLLFVLSIVFPSHFLYEDVLTRLFTFLELAEDNVAPLVLPILSNVGKHRPLGEAFPQLMNVLTPVCKKFATEGTCKQAKHAIRCLFFNLVGMEEPVFSEILDILKSNMSIDNENYRTSIVSLGHISYLLPTMFPVLIKNIVSRKIVKELLMKKSDEPPIDEGDEWCDEHDLTEEIRCKLEGIKMMGRWLLGIKSDIVSAQKTFRMLNAFILYRGDLLQEGKLGKISKAWLRLYAGCCMLKVCEQKGVGDQYNAEQYYNLSLLMVDEYPEVRKRFAQKLHKGLGRGLPNKCLPLDFMGYYALAGHEADKKLKQSFKGFLLTDINKRRDYIKSLLLSQGSDRAAEQLPHIMPDYMIVFAVPVLAHDPDFVDPTDISYLQKIRTCLWFILEPLICKNDNYCFGFYKSLVEKMKNHFDALNPTDEVINHKLWAVCDLAMGLLLSKTVNFDMKDFVNKEPTISHVLFKRHDDPDFVNAKIYLPASLHYQNMKKATITSVVSEKSKWKRKKHNDDEEEEEEEQLEEIVIEEEPSNVAMTSSRGRVRGPRQGSAQTSHSEITANTATENVTFKSKGMLKSTRNDFDMTDLGPRKHASSLEDTENTSNETISEVPVKRRRGRPPINHDDDQGNQSKLTHFFSKKSGESQSDDESVAVPRRRGALITANGTDNGPSKAHKGRKTAKSTSGSDDPGLVNKRSKRSKR